MYKQYRITVINNGGTMPNSGNNTHLPALCHAPRRPHQPNGQEAMGVTVPYKETEAQRGCRTGLHDIVWLEPEHQLWARPPTTPV